MKIAFLALAVLTTATVATSAFATTVTFDEQPEVFFVSSVTDSGFNFQSTFEGFGTNNSEAWPSNGSTHLMSWTNEGYTSGFILTAVNGSVFTLGTFQFGGGYIGGDDAVSSLTVSGTGGASPFSLTFYSGEDFINSQFSTLDLNGLSATEMTFTAYGENNRASFDNFALNSAGAVPEPASWAMMVLGFGLIGSVVRRRNTETSVACTA